MTEGPSSGDFGFGQGEAPVQAFHQTVDLLRADHISAARASVRDPELLRELEEEIVRDCEGLRSFLLAAQVCTYSHRVNASLTENLV